MPQPEMSDSTTQGVRVGARAFFLPDESDPDLRRFVFGYNIVILNEGPSTAKLLTRHWLIIDAQGNQEHVRGPGVVGQTPTLAPGEAFKYTSFCPLRTPWGTMEGEYQMQREDGETFDAKIGRFYLAIPKDPS